MVLDIQVVALEVDQIDAPAVGGQGRAYVLVQHAFDAPHLFE